MKRVDKCVFPPVTDEAMPGASYMISGLEPAHFYHIRVTAQNNRGTATAVFKVATLNGQGGECEVQLVVGE